MTDLSTALRTFAESPVLLVALDFDGTIAYIVSHPDDARPLPRAIAALERLAAMPHTHVAVISGRARDVLLQLMPNQERIHLIGSHGVEMDLGRPLVLSTRQREALAAAINTVESIAQSHVGCVVESKPAGVALHYRLCATDVGQHAHDSMVSAFESLEGVKLRFGNKIVELAVAPGGKGDALSALRHRVGAIATGFMGDDLTDEDAFASLTPGDLSVVIGTQPSRAEHRIASPDDVIHCLEQIVQHRQHWLNNRRLTSITHHAILSDQRTAAIIEPTGCISWLCLPRLDSAALFARLIGGDAAGYFAIESADGAAPTAQRYEADSLLLRTEWPTFSVVDYLDCSGGRPHQRPGRHDLLRVVEGSGRVVARFAPRLDFGDVETRLRLVADGIEVCGSPEPIVLYAPAVQWTIQHEGRHDTAICQFSMSDKPVIFELRYGTAGMRPSRIPEAGRRQQTARFWSAWARSLRQTGVSPELVRRSAIVLKALCYGPSGGIAAAATTSLPEQLGGIRNWDYRFCWPRDAAMAAAALIRLGNTGIALRLCDWLLQIVDACQSPDRLRPIYTLSGGHLGPEAQLNSLSGYGDSRPVRVGNAAAQQVQLDVFGPITDLVSLLVEYGAPVTPEHWRLVRSMAEAVATRWQEPDHGIWEIRGPRRHHVHSKVMCWLTVDRAMRVQAEMVNGVSAEWEALRARIRDDVLQHGWNERVGAFTAAYGGDDLDAASLWIGLSGMLAADDPRFASTVRAVERELLRGPTVFRYRVDDGLPGAEGGFHICTSWLIESYLRMGRVDDARSLFAELVKLAGPSGLLAEQYDPELQLALGNFPQAYSHLGIINAAVAIDATARSA